MKVAELMQTSLKTISTEATIQEAVDALAQAQVSALPVLDRYDRAVGILSTRDVLMAVDGQQMAERGTFFPDGAPGRRYRLQVRRGGEEIELEIVLGPPRPRTPG